MILNKVSGVVGKAGRALKILVVEDSFMTARSLARMLQDLGAEVLGPAPTVKKAMDLLDAGDCDAAVLDINLGNETVEPVAKRLHEGGRPFIFVSGYASPKTLLTHPDYRRHRLVPKPVEPASFRQTLAEEFAEVCGTAPELEGPARD